MVDRITKINTSWNRIQETRDDRGGRRQQREEEKDKFEKGPPFWKKSGLPLPHLEGRRGPEEASLATHQRLMVLWGILDPQGRPRIPIIITYVVVGIVIVISTILAFAIFFGILWR